MYNGLRKQDYEDLHRAAYSQELKSSETGKSSKRYFISRSENDAQDFPLFIPFIHNNWSVIMHQQIHNIRI
jgi:hypothetical protein